MNRSKRYISVAWVMILAIAAGARLASALDDDVIYYACVNNSSGTIFMVGADEECKSSENKIVWN